MSFLETPELLDITTTDAPASVSRWEDDPDGRRRISPSLDSGLRLETDAFRASTLETPLVAERPADRSRADAKRAPQPDPQENEPVDKPRKGFLRRHPVLAPVGLIAVLLGSAAGYLYWDYAAHFESTDDAFIAARQFSIAPEVSGYLTAVPVTDNQHVAAGGVIARIDQRNFLTAVARPKRKSRRRKKASAASTRKSPCNRPRLPRPRRKSNRCRRTWNSRGSPGDATSRSSIRVGRRLSRARSTSRISRPSRPLSRVRKRRSRWRSGRSMC